MFFNHICTPVGHSVADHNAALKPCVGDACGAWDIPSGKLSLPSAAGFTVTACESMTCQMFVISQREACDSDKGNVGGDYKMPTVSLDPV